MNHKGLLWLLKIEAITLLLIVCIYGTNRSLWPGDCFNKWGAALCNSSIQWLILVLLLIVLAGSVCSNAAKSGRFLSFSSPYFWLLGATLTGAGVYVLQYSNSYYTAQAISWFGGAALGQWVATRLRMGSKVDRSLLLFTIVSLIIVLSAGEASSIHYGVVFKYHNHLRWSGFLDNPNIWGLLMGTGVVLAGGLALSTLLFLVFSETECVSEKWSARKYWNWVFAFLYLFGTVLFSRGLYRSYSRGAWVATACGMAYLAFQLFKVQSFELDRQSDQVNKRAIISYNSCISWFPKNWFSVSVILISATVLTFWQFIHARQNVFADRVFSIGNVNDFSWLNRIAAWEGALQITAEHPWLGTGWNQPGPLFQHYFLPSKLDDSAAIQLNDYLMLGATLGLPALICFGIYIWLSLTSEVRNQNLEVIDQEAETRITKSQIGESHDIGFALGLGLWTLHSLQTTCRAGAIILAVGFWFDGGLFKLATASTFWILLELERADFVQQKVTQETKMPPILA